MGTRGLLMVDMQQAFFPPQRLVGEIQAQMLSADVLVATQWLNTPDSPWATRMEYEGVMEGTAAAALALRLPQHAHIFTRYTYGFGAAELDALKALDVAHWYVCGVETDACVLAVAFSLWDARIPFTVLGPLCWTSMGESWHHNTLAMMRRQFGEPAVLDSALIPA